MKWKPVFECDDDEDNPTVWVAEINSKKYGKYVWISCEDDCKYKITTSNYGEDLFSEPIKICKSLVSSKRWVSINIR